MTTVEMEVPRKGTMLVAVGIATLLLALVFGALVGCSPQIVETKDASEQKADPLLSQPVEWSMESDCAICHVQEDETMASADCPQASLHADLQCVQCHSLSDVLVSKHEGLTYGDTTKAVDLKASEITVDAKTCEDPACHGDMEHMAKQTEGKVVLTDSNGNQVNPHKYDSNKQHDANQPTCIDCHKVHSEDIQKDATKWCAQCHHRGVFTCGNCHEIREREVSHSA